MNDQERALGAGEKENCWERVQGFHSWSVTLEGFCCALESCTGLTAQCPVGPNCGSDGKLWNQYCKLGLLERRERRACVSSLCVVEARAEGHDQAAFSSQALGAIRVVAL